jgi:hypothetical protein
MPFTTSTLKYHKFWLLAICFLGNSALSTFAQDTSSKILDLNQLKLVKKINALLDSTQKKINNNISNKTNELNQNIGSGVNNALNQLIPEEETRPLPYERLLNKKYNLGRRAYQNTAAQYNYLFNAEEELKDIIQKARNIYTEDYSSLINFYDYDLADISKSSIDSIIYRCNANIVLHDLRSNWVDDSYLLLAKAYLYHRNFDTAGSILQFINYSFDEKDDGVDQPIGSNLRQVDGRISIATKEQNRIWENANIRNESMLWQARNYFSSNNINEGISLLQLLKGDPVFPKRLNPFLYEQFAYGYYLMESYENAAVNLIEGLPNAPDALAKSRWYYLIAQLWQKSNNTENAYKWYKKAVDFSTNPVIGVYSKINLVRIEAKNDNKSWDALANELEYLLRKEKFKPFADIIYFEMAKLAIENKAFYKSNKWLIKSIISNASNSKQKEQSFELLGEINYKNGNYGIAKIAYDSLTNILKTNPQFEQITLRKKWMSTIYDQINAYEKEDSLQFIYKLPITLQKDKYVAYQKRQNENQQILTNLFNEQSVVMKPSQKIEDNNSNNEFEVKTNDFYFVNNNNLRQGKQQFIQKWGERPNVDMWRRKSSTNVANALAKTNAPSTLIPTNENFENKSSKNQEKTLDTLGLIQDELEFKRSQQKWNEAALIVAQTFLLKLNDFEKAKPIYAQIIKKGIDATITERALLDLASQYLHDGKNKLADSIINIVTTQFPDGAYINKKKESESKKSKLDESTEKYKEYYFLSQIGNWSKMSQLSNLYDKEMIGSKWYTPYQFLKVKMYAQQQQDQMALQILDSIIFSNKTDVIREKAKEIITELKNRKNTEAYLQSLQIIKDPYLDVNQVRANQSINKLDSNDLNTQKNEAILPAFQNDTLENHYIALVINNIDLVKLKKAQSSLIKLNNNNSNYPNLTVTSSQITKDQQILWIGPLSNKMQAITYLGELKPKLPTQIFTYIPKQQYEIYIFGKSNISLINNAQALDFYKEFMINKIYKP